jgi:hypothetical protein
MTHWKIGDEVQVSNGSSRRFGECGVVKEIGPRGGLYITFSDGGTEYHPWGYDIVRGHTSELAESIRDRQRKVDAYPKLVEFVQDIVHDRIHWDCLESVGRDLLKELGELE